MFLVFLNLNLYSYKLHCIHSQLLLAIIASLLYYRLQNSVTFTEQVSIPEVSIRYPFTFVPPHILFRISLKILMISQDTLHTCLLPCCISFSLLVSKSTSLLLHRLKCFRSNTDLLWIGHLCPLILTNLNYYIMFDVDEYLSKSTKHLCIKSFGLNSFHSLHLHRKTWRSLFCHVCFIWYHHESWF